MKNSRFVFVPVHNNSIPGTGTTGDYYVVAGRAYNTIFQCETFATGLGLLTTTFTEGVDFPFNPHRWDSQDTAAYLAHAAVDARVANYLQVALLGLGSAYALIYSPEPTPNPYLEIFPFPFDAIAKKGRLEAFAAMYATSAAPGSWLPGIPADTYRVPVCEVFDEIQFHLLEVADFGASMGSALWTITEVINYINLRTYRFYLETGLLQKRAQIPVAANSDEIDLPTDLIDIKRIAWVRAGLTTELPRADLEQVDAWIPDWESVTATDPVVYSQAPEPSLSVRLAPTVSLAGVLDLTYVARPDAVTNDCSIFPLPDEWVPFVKYGVLADMWAKEGECNDPERSAYCEQRYHDGIDLARLLLGDAIEQ